MNSNIMPLVVSTSVAAVLQPGQSWPRLSRGAASAGFRAVFVPQGDGAQPARFAPRPKRLTRVSVGLTQTDSAAALMSSHGRNMATNAGSCVSTERRSVSPGPHDSVSSPLSQQAATNIRAVVALEEATRARGTGTERLIDGIARVMASPIVIGSHLAWFATWICSKPRRDAFDRFPFSLLTLTVSLEAILLSMFLLVAQNRMSGLAERRAHLDLQINLLAEQELTAILRLLCRLADKAGVDISDEPALTPVSQRH